MSAVDLFPDAAAAWFGPRKAFHVDDGENTIYAAADAHHALHLWRDDADDGFGLGLGLDDIHELTDAELDAEHDDTDEDERPNGKKITIRQMLTDAKYPGFLCGGAS